MVAVPAFPDQHKPRPCAWRWSGRLPEGASLDTGLRSSVDPNNLLFGGPTGQCHVNCAMISKRGQAEV